MVWAKDFSSSALSSVIKWPMAVTVSHLFLLISPNKSTFTNHFYNIFNTFRGSETFLDHLGYVDWGLFPDISIFLKIWDFPGSPEVKTSPSNAGGVGSIPGRGAKIPHASRPKNQKHKKKKQYCNKFNKDFKIHWRGCWEDRRSRSSSGRSLLWSRMRAGSWQRSWAWTQEQTEARSTGRWQERGSLERGQQEKGWNDSYSRV